MEIPYLHLGQLNAQWHQEIEQAALRVIRSGYYLNEAEVSAFEDQWAAKCKARYCISTANGLDALTASLQSLKTMHGWPDGSEVIVSAHTFIASFEAVTRLGLKAVPCDVSAEYYNIDCDIIPQLINAHTVAIMPVHIYGRSCDIAQICTIADSHNLKIVIDSCQLHGMANPIGDAAAYSFYPGKNLGALGDAGCLVTDNKELADIARAYCNYGAASKYRHTMKGINSRMDSVQAAILSVKLAHLDEQNAIRQTIASRYNTGIHNPHILLPYGGNQADKSCWHIYPVFCEHRDKLQEWLASRGIGTIVHYPVPPHKQKAYKELNHLTLPVTERICASELSLPLYPTLTAAQQDYIISTVNDFRP